MEKTLKCSGMCKKYDYGIFYDINKNRMIKKSCKEAIEDFILERGIIIYCSIGLFIVYLIVNLIIINLIIKKNNAKSKVRN